MNPLRREFPLREIKVESGSDGDMLFSGYGAVFNNVDYYGDLIEPGAFAENLVEIEKEGQWPSMLLQHGGWGIGTDDLSPIGVWTELAEDGKGLKVNGKLADTVRGIESYKLLKMEPRPAIDGLSIGYIPQEWENRVKPDDPRRRLKKISLVEISLVTFPANLEARVKDVKSLDECEDLASIEVYLRDAGGFSRREVKNLVARVKHVCQRDVGDDGIVGIAAAIVNNINSLRI